MDKTLGKMNIAFSPLLIAMILLLAFGTFSAAQERYYSEDAWSFGIMGDTQWTLGIPIPGWEDDPEGTNPNFVSMSIANQLNEKFIKHGVKFVIQVGDLTNWAGEAAIATRAQGAQILYDEGIGFFPMRGNHETYGYIFGLDPDGTWGVPEIQSYFPQTRGLSNTFGASNFSSPTDVSADLDGISYSFDYGKASNSARFVILDPWGTESRFEWYDGLYVWYGYTFGMQQAWIDGRLDEATRGTTHAFVLSHQNLLGQNHEDTPFGGYPGEYLDAQNAFYGSLEDNGIRYYISGHDHLHNSSILTSPDGESKVEQLISAPASPKFYTPEPLDYEGWQGQKYRELQLSQELYNIGYYIYTIDGPRVTVDYYADEDDNFMSSSNYPNSSDPAFTPKVTPKFNFAKKDTWGYSLNGKEFLVMQDAPYISVMDIFNGTTLKILSGLNNSADVDGNERHLTKAVNTGWTPANSEMLISDILSLWGMGNLGSDQTDTYTLSLTYNYGKYIEFATGSTGIATLDSNGKWVNAVDFNRGGTKKFVLGPWKTGYELGTYGIDAATGTAWAVINYNGDFAVSRAIHPAVPGPRE